jgi:hypothetical protein
MKKFYWDLETSPLDDEQLLNKLMPDFTAASNVKDPVKIATAIEEKKKDWLDKTALKAITGKIVAVTMAKDGAEPILAASLEDEKGLIEVILHELKNVISDYSQAYAWNGSGFDLPFLCQRAAVHGVTAFKDLTQQRGARFSWNENLIDPKLVWSNYSPDHTGTSLKSVALALGVGEKSGSGKDFAGLLKTNPDEAKAYALNDVNLLRSIVQRMGI